MYQNPFTFYSVFYFILFIQYLFLACINFTLVNNFTLLTIQLSNSDSDKTYVA